MKKNILKSIFISTFVVTLFCWGLSLQHSDTDNEIISDLLLENVEALTQGDDVLKCTRAITFEECYQTYTYYLPNGEKVTQKIATHMRITAVEEYEVETNSPVSCLHDYVTPC